MKAKNLTPTEIHKKLVTKRGTNGMKSPTLCNVWKVLKGKTYKRGSTETRGRPKTLTTAQLRKIYKTREELILKTKGEEEITWPRVLKAARVRCDPTTAAKNLKEAGYDVEARRHRLKSLRPEDALQERFETASRWRRYPASYWTDTLHLIMDNKRWEVPTHEMAKRAAKIRKVRFILRTRAEGLKKGFTKPHPKKHKMNPGASVSVVAGISRGRVRV